MNKTMRSKMVMGVPAMLAATGSVMAVAVPTASADHGVTYCGHGTSGEFLHSDGLYWRAVYLSVRSTPSVPHLHKYLSQFNVGGFWLDSHTYERAC